MTRASAELMQHLLHELSQPLLAAALSADTALILLPRGDEAAALERMEATALELRRALMLVRVMKLANGCGPGGWPRSFDPAQILGRVMGGLDLPSAGEAMGDRDYFEAAISGLVMALNPRRDACRAAPAADRKRIRLTLRGSDQHPAILRFWINTLRKAGISVRSRRVDGEVIVHLSIAA
jgi:hypothetical protein